MAKTERSQSQTLSVCKHMASDYMCDKLEICVCFGVHFRIRTSNDAVLYLFPFPASVAKYLYSCTHVLTVQVVNSVYVCAAAICAFKSFTRDFVNLCKRVCACNIV